MKLLIVEDEQLEREALRFLIREFFPAFEIFEARNAPEFERLVSDVKPDVVLLDLNIPGGNGLSSLMGLRKKGFSGQVVVVTAYHTLTNVTRALEEEVSSFLKKPVRSETLKTAVEKCLHRHREQVRQASHIDELEKEVAYLRQNEPSSRYDEAPAHTPLERALEFIRKHPREATLEKTAQNADVSPNHLSRLFHKEHGKRFVEVQKEARMRRAWTLLAEGASVREAAAESGYGSVAYFGTAFKKMFGCTPGECRRRSSKAG